MESSTANTWCGTAPSGWTAITTNAGTETGVMTTMTAGIVVAATPRVDGATQSGVASRARAGAVAVKRTGFGTVAAAATVPATMTGVAVRVALP
jgi:hypothetical protein